MTFVQMKSIMMETNQAISSLNSNYRAILNEIFRGGIISMTEYVLIPQQNQSLLKDISEKVKTIMTNPQ